MEKESKVERRERPFVTEKDMLYIREHADVSCDILASKLGVHRSTVYRIKRKLGVLTKQIAWTPEMREYVKAERAKGYTSRDIGMKLGVTAENVQVHWR